MHPLLPILLDAAEGSFPPVDGGVTFLPPLAGGWEAIVSFTGHAFVASRLPAEAFADLHPDGYGGILHPGVQLRMAAGGRVGVIDATLVGRGRGGGTRSPRTDLDHHPRVQYARDQRREVQTFGDPDGLFTIGLGLAGRTEMSIETSDSGTGRGRQLISDALTMVPQGFPLFAAVSPGNARSLRSFLACSFVPIGSEVLIRPASRNLAS